MHQSIPAAPSPPRATVGHLPAFSVPGVGHLQILRCPGAGHLQTPGPTPIFWHARSFLSAYNYSEDFTGKTSRLAHYVKDGKKLKRFVKACSRFYACISSLLIKPELHRGTRELSTWTKWRLFGYWILFLNIIWRISFHIYITIHSS